jgi:S-adenosylmethionine synthetase
MELIVSSLTGRPLESLPLEVVERKGLGHPDTICDAVAEELSIRLGRFYRDRFGIILHHNVDKALLYGGRATPAFGGGTVHEPMELYLSGRATRRFRGVDIPVEEIAMETARTWFARNLHALDPERHLRVQCLIRPGSVDLVRLFARQAESGVALANDTSCGVGFAPRTDLEAVVLSVEKKLNAPEIKESHPEIGEDIKVMGVRRASDIRLTLACAFVDRHLAEIGAYLEAKTRLAAIAADTARQVVSGDIAVEVNTGDDPDNGNVYITVTGTSAEAGDDGQVGRGNRANGLITPFRPMTMEAASGKNPVSHVGKLYNIAAGRIARDIVDQVQAVTEARCCLVSQIGRPVSDPQIAGIELYTGDPTPPPAVERKAREIVNHHLAGLHRLWESVIEGAVPVF